MKQRVSDTRLKQQTGRDWQAWFDVLDKAKAITMPRREIARFLRSDFNINPWWAQMVTVGYEQARGLREKHQKPSGYEISVSKTITAPASVIFNAWIDDSQCCQWLDCNNLVIHKATPHKSLHITWTDGKKCINVDFYPKASGKTQVTLQHGKLESAAAAEDMKAYWKNQLIQLQQFCDQLCSQSDQ